MAAKLTFLTCVLDEVPLTPKPDAVAPVSWRERASLFRHPVFHTPPGLIPSPPSSAPPTPVVVETPDAVAAP